jgi:hypothetical protein
MDFYVGAAIHSGVNSIPRIQTIETAIGANTAFSLAGWCKKNATRAWADRFAYFLEYSEATYDGAFGIGYNTVVNPYYGGHGEEFTFWTSYNAGGDLHQVHFTDDTFSIADLEGGWHFVACGRETDGTYWISVTPASDASPASRVEAAGATADLANVAANMKVGWTNDVAGRFWEGLYTNIMFFDILLTDGHLEWLFNGGNGNKWGGKNLLLYDRKFRGNMRGNMRGLP